MALPCTVVGPAIVYPTLSDFHYYAFYWDIMLMLRLFVLVMVHSTPPTPVYSTSNP